MVAVAVPPQRSVTVTSRGYVPAVNVDPLVMTPYKSSVMVRHVMSTGKNKISIIVNLKNKNK